MRFKDMVSADVVTQHVLLRHAVCRTKQGVAGPHIVLPVAARP